MITNFLDKYLVCNVPHDAASDAAAAAAAAEAAKGTAWHAGLDAELVGHVTNRGWDKLDPAKAAAEAAKAHREAERLIGVPADRIIRLPQDLTDPAGMKPVWQKLGAPAEAKDYDFSSVKDAAGQPIAAPLAEAIRATAFEASVPKDVATKIAATVVKHFDSVTKEANAVAEAKLTEERAALKTNWTTNHDANMVVARDGAVKLGVTPEEVAALEKVVGYAKTMEMFRKVGAASAEHNFINPSNGGNNNAIMTREQAIARKAELTADTEWGKRYMNGGAPEKREMDALVRIIVGEAAVAEAQVRR